MHVLFVHKNFPAQFGHIAQKLITECGYQCTFVSELPAANVNGIQRIQYKTAGGARDTTHYCSRTFENFIWHSHAVYETLRSRPEIRPDLIVGHSGFGSTAFLADLYDCPIINYCEYYYHGTNSDMDFRPETPPKPLDVLRARSRNAGLLLDLQAAAAAYSPTEWQRSRFPAEYQPGIRVIFDGIDTKFWKRRPIDRGAAVQLGGRAIGPDTKIVTYVSRGFESMRGFDIFMQVAQRICDSRQDVVFVCVGSDRVCYGSDLTSIEEPSFRQHVLNQGTYDLDRFIFTGMLEPDKLVNVLSVSDLHIYLTVPFVLSWSVMNALSCECVVLGSDTPPVQEMIQHGQNGLLADFFDIDGLTDQALRVLADPTAFRQLGESAGQIIRERFSIDVTLPRMLDLYEEVAASG